MIEAGEGFDSGNLYIMNVDPFKNQTNLIYNLSQNEAANDIFCE